MNTTWNLNELKQNCSNLISEQADIYLKTIQRKEEHISFLTEKLSALRDIPTGDQQEIKQIKLQTEIYLESLMQNLNSLPDAIAHLIMVIIINPLPENFDNILIGRSINFHSVLQALNRFPQNSSTPNYRQRYIASIREKMDQLKQSSQYQYVKDLVNTTKHRHLISVEYVAGRTGCDWKFLAFTIDGRGHGEVNGQEVIEDRCLKFLNLFHEIGQEINNYCLAYRIENPN